VGEKKRKIKIKIKIGKLIWRADLKLFLTYSIIKLKQTGLLGS